MCAIESCAREILTLAGFLALAWKVSVMRTGWARSKDKNSQYTAAWSLHEPEADARATVHERQSWDLHKEPGRSYEVVQLGSRELLFKNVFLNGSYQTVQLAVILTVRHAAKYPSHCAAPCQGCAAGNNMVIKLYQVPSLNGYADPSV